MKVQYSDLVLNEQPINSLTLEEACNIPLPEDILSSHDESAKGSQSPGNETPTSHDSDIKANVNSAEVMEVE